MSRFFPSATSSVVRALITLALCVMITAPATTIVEGMAPNPAERAAAGAILPRLPGMI
jgi:hypothetical protein